MKNSNVVGIIGNGQIANHLNERLLANGITPAFRLGRSAAKELRGKLSAKKPGVVFLAIPTLDGGEAARDYILSCVVAGAVVITCEKGALSYHAAELAPKMSMIGCSATVGGGSGLIDFVKDRARVCDHPIEIELVVNGTLNFVFDRVQGGDTIGQACQDAIHSGYAEPGATDPVSLINGELRDVVMKACALHNVALSRGSFVTPDNMPEMSISGDDLAELESSRRAVRMIVTISNNRIPALEYVGCPSLSHPVSGWYMSMGMRVIQDAAAFSWLPKGVDNAAHVKEGTLGEGGINIIKGPGAGPYPTVTAMLRDYFRFFPRK